MLEKPNLPDTLISACLRDTYGITVAQIAFLPLGADANTAVYRVVDADGTPYFLKLRSGPFDELVVAIPQLLSQQGMHTIIAPLPTRTQQLWTQIERFTAILQPYVDGQNGFATELSDQQWVELGSALRQLHTAVLPPALQQRLPRETYAPDWRERLTTFLARIDDTSYSEPVAARLVAFMQTKRAVLHDLVERATRLADTLRTQTLAEVLCHADIHAANLLIDASGRLYIVDWDTIILAPKERDLMFVGAGLSIGDTAAQAAQFYQGYGPAAGNPLALAYYRYQRIIEDIAVTCEQLLLTDEGGADRERSLGYVVASFEPGDVVERAYALDAR